MCDNVGNAQAPAYVFLQDGSRKIFPEDCKVAFSDAEKAISNLEDSLSLLSPCAILESPEAFFFAALLNANVLFGRDKSDRTPYTAVEKDKLVKAQEYLTKAESLGHPMAASLKELIDSSLRVDDKIEELNERRKKNCLELKRHIEQNPQFTPPPTLKETRELCASLGVYVPK